MGHVKVCSSTCKHAAAAAAVLLLLLLLLLLLVLLVVVAAAVVDVVMINNNIILIIITTTIIKIVLINDNVITCSCDLLIDRVLDKCFGRYIHHTHRCKQTHATHTCLSFMSTSTMFVRFVQNPCLFSRGCAGVRKNKPSFHMDLCLNLSKSLQKYSNSLSHCLHMGFCDHVSPGERFREDQTNKCKQAPKREPKSGGVHMECSR